MVFLQRETLCPLSKYKLSYFEDEHIPAQSKTRSQLRRFSVIQNVYKITLMY